MNAPFPGQAPYPGQAPLPGQAATPGQAAPYPGQAPDPAGAVYRVRLTKVSSFVVTTQRRAVTHTGTLDQLEGIARSTLTHNLLLGWWGVPFGLVWTPTALIQNASAMRKLREAAARG